MYLYIVFVYCRFFIFVKIGGDVFLMGIVLVNVLESDFIKIIVCYFIFFWY